jgi:hypothetical protein
MTTQQVKTLLDRYSSNDHRELCDALNYLTHLMELQRRTRGDVMMLMYQTSKLQHQLRRAVRR